MVDGGGVCSSIKVGRVGGLYYFFLFFLSIIEMK